MRVSYTNLIKRNNKSQMGLDLFREEKNTIEEEEEPY